MTVMSITMTHTSTSRASLAIQGVQEVLIDMYVQLENGVRFEQRKHVVTTIDRPSDSTTASPSGSPAVLPVK